jgi:hypothetical protein
VLAFFLSAAQALWVLLKVVAVLQKVIEHGIVPYVRHFTNWSWTLQLIFYALTLGAAPVRFGLVSANSALGRFTRTVIVVGLFPINGIVFTVMFGVSVLLGTGSPFLSEFLTKYPPEIVFLGNDLFHFWPIVVLLIYYIVYRKLVLFSLNRVVSQLHLLDSPVRFSVFVLYLAYGGAIVALGIYSVLFDPRVVYETDLSIASGFLVALVALTIFSLLPLLYILGLLGVASREALTLDWLYEFSDDARAYAHNRQVKVY